MIYFPLNYTTVKATNLHFFLFWQETLRSTKNLLLNTFVHFICRELENNLFLTWIFLSNQNVIQIVRHRQISRRQVTLADIFLIYGNIHESKIMTLQKIKSLAIIIQVNKKFDWSEFDFNYKEHIICQMICNMHVHKKL